MFGGDLFFDIVGEMKLYIIQGMINPEEGQEQLAFEEEAHKQQRIEELTHFLNVRLEPYLIGERECINSIFVLIQISIRKWIRSWARRET